MEEVKPDEYETDPNALICRNGDPISVVIRVTLEENKQTITRTKR